MSNSSNNNGRAYEYAWITGLNSRLNQDGQSEIQCNSSYESTKKAWDKLNHIKQSTYLVSIDAAMDNVLDLEPVIRDKNLQGKIFLALQDDTKGVRGDVRDLVITRDGTEWEIGLSIKHNHQAIKHSRLSKRLDFGKSWLDSPCSDFYWNDVEPIFGKLEELKQQNVKWSEIQNKFDGVYVPLLEAFISEVKRKDSELADLPKRMVEYLVGVKDYYKVICRESQKDTIIESFNLHGTLNQDSNSVSSSIEVAKVKLPDEMVKIQFKKDSKNTVEAYFNNGWQISFRIHNASTIVEPSLKFDVQFVGLPPTVSFIQCKWSEKER